MFSILGDVTFGDRVEALTYNALPATMTPDSQSLPNRCHRPGTCTCSNSAFPLSVCGFSRLLVPQCGHIRSSYNPHQPSTDSRLSDVPFHSMSHMPLPSTSSVDCAQYLQQSNEVSSEVQKDWWWNSDGGDSNLYGLEPNYGCCTANHPQGFPKMITSSYMLTQREGEPLGIFAALLGPSSVSVLLNHTNQVMVDQQTDYPFAINPVIRFVINAQQPFPFSVRIPSWAQGASVTLDNGTVVAAPEGSVWKFSYVPPKEGASNTTISLTLPTRFRVVGRFNGAVSVYYGPLLMAIDLGHEQTVLRHYAYKSQDLSFMPTKEWRLALQLNNSDIQSSFSIKQQPIGAYPFDPDHPPLIVSAYARAIDWPTKHSGADEPPMSPVKSTQPLVPITLIPYGSTLLRISEIPVLAQTAEPHSQSQSKARVASAE